ncbi:DUF3289 family protein [Treponema sp.]|uniref:DUF3289 family protein n=1 Tax=Treponema sp. TaxID=166 RepID=UPI0025797CCC|nr:DUF3289 family protein [Treponema sp.]
MINVHIVEDKITSATGVWFYASKLLKDNDLINSGKNQYKLLLWLETENKGKIKDHSIKEQTIIKRPKEKNDIIAICLFEIKLNNEKQAIIQQEYSISYPDKTIFEHPHLPGKDKNDSSKTAEDIDSGNLTKQDIIDSYKPFESDLKKSINNEKIDKFKASMKGLLSICSQNKWKTAAFGLYNHFCEGTGKDYNDLLLTQLVKEHPSTIFFVKNCKQRFMDFIKNYSYDIMEFDEKKFLESFYGEHGYASISRPVFDDTFGGSKICLHDIQGFTITVTNFVISNKGFSCLLYFDLYDRFGLDLQDVKSFSSIPYASPRFRAWYILQHLKSPKTGCKAFVDHMKFSELVKVEF